MLREFRVKRDQKSMVIQLMGENSKSVSKFLPLFIFRHNFKEDSNQINTYKCFENIQFYTFIILLKIARKKNKGVKHKNVLFVSFGFLSLFKEELKRC